MTPRSETEAVTLFRPFVLKEAKRFSSSGASFEDLIQEGLIAVAMAFRSWSPDGGAGFLSWIQQPVRFAMLRVVRDKRRAGGSFRGGKRGVEKPFVQVVSLDSFAFSEAVDEELQSAAHDLSFDDVLGAPENQIDSLALENLPRLLALLPSRERRVIRFRFEQNLTHAQVGAKLKISRELARQIEIRALKRLREMMLKEEPQA